MSLKVLNIILENILLGEKRIGYMILNGNSGTSLKKFKINPPYDKMITMNNMLREGNDYEGFTHDEYISLVKNKLRKDIKKKILIQERKLSRDRRTRLARQY